MWDLPQEKRKAQVGEPKLPGVCSSTIRLVSKLYESETQQPNRNGKHLSRSVGCHTVQGRQKSGSEQASRMRPADYSRGTEAPEGLHPGSKNRTKPAGTYHDCLSTSTEISARLDSALFSAAPSKKSIYLENVTK